MSEIDAPEVGQPHGDTASDALLARLHETVVTVIQEGTSEQGRPIGHLYLDDEWLNGWAVSEGHAWVHSPSAQTMALHDLQDEARREGRGLWAGQAPVPPWQWRDGDRTAIDDPTSSAPPKERYSQIAPDAVDSAHDLMRGATRAEPNG
ncbi:thermonuclease family protein [Halomonas sp. C05BenzN]|uniref:thermonuclease family protein n=1 Tax=Halomonas sp. C05BenzN TaxID=3411041 RepID=UPI003B93F370